jgi:hypothetical protein
MAGARVLEPEWLDELPAADPRALRSRRDLVRINALMGNGAIVRRDLARAGAIRSIAEIGAGNGLFLLAAVKSLRMKPETALLVDRQRIVSEPALRGFASLGCEARAVSADVFEWLSDDTTPALDAIVANLFLHHFDSEALARMLALVARRARFFVACEPRRGAVAMAGARLLGLAGCNDVSRHDAVVSVRAVFVDGEITALWPAGPGWACEERARGLFSHGFVARRIE